VGKSEIQANIPCQDLENQMKSVRGESQYHKEPPLCDLSDENTEAPELEYLIYTQKLL
jgi:hypothetical protein